MLIITTTIVVAAQHTAAMAGLGVLEARTTNEQQKQQLLRPTEVPASRTPSPVIRRAYMRHKLHLAPMLVPSIPSWSFLQRCFLCQRELTEGMDIYMYRSVQFATQVSVMMSCSSMAGKFWFLMIVYGYVTEATGRSAARAAGAGI